MKDFASCLTLNENQIEDEYHVLLGCPFYGDLRKIYLCKMYDPPNLHTLLMLCVLKLRKILLSSMFCIKHV